MKFFAVAVLVACFSASFALFFPKPDIRKCAAKSDCNADECCLLNLPFLRFGVCSKIGCKSLIRTCSQKSECEDDECCLKAPGLSTGVCSSLGCKVISLLPKIGCGGDEDCGDKQCCLKIPKALLPNICLPKISDRIPCNLVKLPAACNDDSSCGSDTCCYKVQVGAFSHGRCLPKIAQNLPCNIPGYPCGCAEGLECKLTSILNIQAGTDGNGDLKPSLHLKARRCVPVESIDKPNVVDIKPEGNQRRFINLGSISQSIGEAINNLANNVIRKCDDHADCGNNRCCSSVPAKIFGSWVGKRCLETPLLMKGLPCVTDGCCESGTECRALGTVDVLGNEVLKVKTCQAINEPSVEEVFELSD